MSISCINVVGLATSPNPQSGINNVFGAQVYLDYWPVDENVIVTGYLRDDDNPTNIYEFNLTINTGAQSAETLNNVLICGPTATATVFITGVTPTTVTYTGTSYPICGFEPTPTPTDSETPTPTPTTTSTPTPSVTLEVSPTQTETPTQTPTQTLTQTCTQTLTQTCTQTETPTQTPTQTPTSSPGSSLPPTETPTQTPSETPTQTPTPSPTTPPVSVWYQITNCADSSIEYSEEYPFGTFAINERVTSPGNVWVITGSVFVDPGGTLYAITTTGLTGCPSISTPTPTQTETPTQTPTSSPGSSLPPTETPTETPTQTPSETPTQTPTSSPGSSLPPTETPTETPTPTPSITATETETPTPTPTPTPSITATETETPTPTPNPTSTSTPSETPTNTPTQTLSPSPSPTLGFSVQFVDCSNNTNIFRFNDPAIPPTTGVTYYITGSTSFSGCATSVQYDGSGPQYNGAGVSFLMTAGGCGDDICPRSSNVAALMARCSDGEVFYFNVEEDTAFVGAAYLYDGVCYSFIEFSGPGGDNIGTPLYENCIDCLNEPTPTPTPYVTPTNTPTVSATPPACAYSTFCLSSTLPSVINYNGNYTNSGTYNGKNYYQGDGATTGYIYYVTGSTEYWCLSNTLGGTCILQGASPCYSQCPDILANGFTSGVCPTPTPTPISCNDFDFNAYFDCDWEPIPTPTPSVACDDVNFTLTDIGVTPTPSPTGIICNGNAVIFSMSGYTPAITPTVTLTPSVTLTRTVDVQGRASFNMLDDAFTCTSVKVLTNCNTSQVLYTSSSLIYDGTPVLTGMTFFGLVNGEDVCVTYTRNDSNFSSNAIVSEIFDIYSNCANCSNVPTPTPTITSSPTPTPSATEGLTPTPTSTPPITPTQTASQTPTPSQTSTFGSTPTQTPSNTPTETPSQTPTQTQTATNTPTPSITKSPTPTPNWVYVYQSCEQIQFGEILSFAQVIQTQEVTFVVAVGETFRDDQGNCWSYVGRFEVDYIVPPTMTPITFQGNYFADAVSTIYADCDECLVPIVTPQQTIVAIGGNMQSCVGGTIDDYMGAYVLLDSPVTVDTTVEVIVYYQYANSFITCDSTLSNNNSVMFTVFIPSGETSGSVEACSNGSYFSMGANICGACANSSDNPNINFGVYGC